MLSASPTVELLDDTPENSLLRYFVALGFGIVFLMAASMFGGTIAQSVVEEKQTRVVELLIAAIPVRALLAGKVLGNTVLAMAQIVALAFVAVVGLSVSGQSVALTGLGGPIAWFAVFFLFGFVLLAALFAAAGADGVAAGGHRRDHDAADDSHHRPVLPRDLLQRQPGRAGRHVVRALQRTRRDAAADLSRAGAQWWEPLLSLAILIATCVAAVLVGSRIYENAILRMGGRVKLREALAS